MSTAHVSLVVVLAAAVGGGAAWMVVAQQPTEPKQHPTGPGERRDPSDPPPIANAEVPAPPENNEESAGMLLLPDGSEVKPLNGVKNPPKLLWQNPQWSPIIGTEHSSGIDWYVHADGTYSTTIMLWRSDLGRHDAVTQVLHPRDAVPTRPLPGSAQPPGNNKK